MAMFPCRSATRPFWVGATQPSMVDSHSSTEPARLTPRSDMSSPWSSSTVQRRETYSPEARLTGPRCVCRIVSTASTDPSFAR